MRVLLTGSHGLIGSELTKSFDDVTRLVRSNPHKDDVLWDPQQRLINLDSIEGFDAVIHLAGEPIFKGRLTEVKMREIYKSRVNGTQFLSESLARLSAKPKVLVCASAVGYYGNRGEETLTEDSPAGKGFLPEVCKAWEAAATPASNANIRVVNTRFGIVLSEKGGALKALVPPFRFGLGAALGDGKQYFSWIDVDDLCRAVAEIVHDANIRGAVNVSSPQPVRNADFTRSLARALHRPAFLRIPKWLLRMILGDFADEALASQRVIPKKLLDSGFQFQFGALDDALKNHLMQR